MSETRDNTRGRFKDSSSLPIDNPEVSPKHDWWDELCKAHGAKNHWGKDKKIRPSKLPKSDKEENQ
jgi:hypothetical protein